MMEVCTDNRFEIIEKAKEHLLEATNIDTSEDEMKVLDSFLFRCWQMGWLDKYDDGKTENCSGNLNNCETCNHYKLTCDLFSEICKYEPKDEPSCDTCKLKDTTEWCKRQEICRAYQPKDELHHSSEVTEMVEPKTDCKVCLYRNIPKDSPHCISCKNNSNFERDWVAELQMKWKGMSK